MASSSIAAQILGQKVLMKLKAHLQEMLFHLLKKNMKETASKFFFLFPLGFMQTEFKEWVVVFSQNQRPYLTYFKNKLESHKISLILLAEQLFTDIYLLITIAEVDTYLPLHSG